ncbi:HipA N-terminal domain-containing protein [Flavihumibacter stibioxidans]|uniref:Phosphatidylinositol kinase n=1 Tax=Flavihumibacter stibioxidans TaxID=1834163 RepID=A0ABR7M9K5_9BACT|nr:HipA N-terminal domain-containing protein [Flavihumibacter stibioxidans]MBC6491713.1 phosphatidylinositol kinase [Flavihumibacter stibioxidans]
MRKANVYMQDKLAGYLSEIEDGYHFIYDRDYLQMPSAEAVSLTLPLSDKGYVSSVMFPFFDGLIPEGWLLEVAAQNWKLNQRDRMGLLLVCCRDCIGAVSIVETQNIEG